MSLLRGNKRRAIWALPLVLAAELFFAGMTIRQAAPAGAAESRPNIVIIVTDDQRYSNTMRVMPSTRRLFWKGGVRMTNGFTTTPLCCPARASIMTGRYAHNHQVFTTKPGQAEKLEQGSTVQRYLHDAGYQTALFGKYLNNWDISLPPPYFDNWSMIQMPAADPRGFYTGGTWNVQGDVRSVWKYSTDYLAQSALGFVDDMESRDQKPWMLYLGTPAAHGPAIPEREYRDSRVPEFKQDPTQREADRSDKPPFVQDRDTRYRGVVVRRRRQLRTLISVDDMVRRLFERLDARNESANTLAFFISDNGLLWGDHGVAGKSLPYSGSVRVPFMMRWPRSLPAGSTDDRLTANIDIAPTILEAAGLSPDDEYPMDGRSLLTAGERERILLEFWRLGKRTVPDWKALRNDTEQYTEYYDSDGSVIFREYYDLARDPYQLQNILADADPLNDAPAEALRLQLSQDADCSGASCP